MTPDDLRRLQESVKERYEKRGDITGQPPTERTNSWTEPPAGPAPEPPPPSNRIRPSKPD